MILMNAKRRQGGFTLLESTDNETLMTLKRARGHSLTGFTLIELMLYLSLTTGIIIVICLVSISLAEHRVRAYERGEVLYAASFSIDAIRTLVYESRAILKPEPGDEDGELILIDTDGNTVTLREVDGVLVLEREGEETVALTTPDARVADLSLARTVEDTHAPFTLSFTISSRANDDISIHLEETMGIRISL